MVISEGGTSPQPREKRGLTVLEEEDENRKQSRTESRDSKRSVVKEDESESSEPRYKQLRKKGRKFRRKAVETSDGSAKKESEIPNVHKVSQDGDDEASQLFY